MMAEGEEEVGDRQRRSIAIGKEEVERVDGRRLSYQEFVERFLRRNRPVVLTGLMDGWRACADWVTSDGRPNLPFFASHFANSLVQVADCSEKEFSDQKRFEISVTEFISYWVDLSARKSNLLCCMEENRSLLYLKDWHFVKEYPNYVAYETPTLFLDDWLNIYLDSYSMHQDSHILQNKNEINCADYRFVYMGPKGTWTPLHADVFRSYSWSANVCGRKRWLFLPPSQCHLIFDRNFRTSVYNVYDDVSEKQFPGFKKTVWLECTQEQNEIIFVPSGWYHQVHNLEDTISINHNWFNAYNLSWVWNLLSRDYKVAKEYIEDIRDICDDFESLCQRNLAANTGMNFHDLMVFITRFALASLIQLFHIKNDEDSFSSSSNTSDHYIVNLMSIRAVASKMKSVEPFMEQDLISCSSENYSVFFDIEKSFEEKNFQELCTALIRTYESISGTQEQDLEINGRLNCQEDITDLILSSISKISCPEDLVRLIDLAMEVKGNTLRNCNFGMPSEICLVEPCAI